MKKSITNLALASALTLGMAGTAIAKETVVIGEQSWDGARAIQSVLQVIMEERLNVNVEIQAVDMAVMWKAMDKGNGSIDVVPDMWTPAHNDKMKQFVARGSRESVTVNSRPYNGSQGYYIPGYIQDEYGVKSVYDLADPKIAKLFDNDGDGEGDYWPGDPSWNSTNVSLVKAKSYGFDRFYKQMVISDAVFKGQLQTAFRKKQGILFDYWTPEWIHSEYDLRMLEEPEFNGYAMDSKKDDPAYNPKGCWNMLQPKEVDNWLEKSRVECAFPPTTVYVAFSKRLDKAAPKVAKFLTQVNLDPKDVNSWILAIAKDEMEPIEVAAQWVKNNPEKVNGWLSGI
jgi:glycine betaine/proline transport system substrate-binding protein